MDLCRSSPDASAEEPTQFRTSHVRGRCIKIDEAIDHPPAMFACMSPTPTKLSQDELLTFARGQCSRSRVDDAIDRLGWIQATINRFS
jgi:hypothetical protein